MHKKDMIKLHKKLSKILSESRYEHTVSVANTACCLAMKYGVDIDKAYLAGLLHDCAKYMSDNDMLEFAKKKKIEITHIEKSKPDLLHAKIGSYLAKEEYDVKDTEICDAIKCHTTGKPGMTLFEKILFIADYIAFGRDKMPRLDEVRKAAFENIDECLKMILTDSVEYLKNSGMLIDDTTMLTYEYYLE